MRTRSRFHQLPSTLIVIGYLLAFFWCVPGVPSIVSKLRGAYSLSEAWWGALCIFGWLGVVLAMGAALRGLSGKPRLALSVFLLIVLPLWGLVLNALMGEECQPMHPRLAYQPFACPEVYGVFALHLATAGGYAISERRPEPLSPRVEPWVVSLLLSGVLLNLTLAIQLVDLVPWLLLFPLTLPVITPFALVVLFWRELARRLREHADRAQTPPMLGPGLLRLPFIVGLHALIQGLWLRSPSGALDVVARTCTHPLSTLPLRIRYVYGGHYLCTVAALGHPSLVRPERLGVRRGKVIIVNRQLAIANAFEDLLHARWPRFGRLARRCYDRLAIPICGWIRNRWLADLLYLSMKPAEWLFYLALLALDPECPEARIDRMYR